MTFVYIYSLEVEWILIFHTDNCMFHVNFILWKIFGKSMDSGKINSYTYIVRKTFVYYGLPIYPVCYACKFDPQPSYGYFYLTGICHVVGATNLK